MEAFASYLMKSAIWLTGFTVVYFLFLRNERFFKLKRIYLIAGILISFIFPLLSFHYQVDIPAPDLSRTDFSGMSGGVIPMLNQNVEAKSFDYRLILLFIYLSGMILLLFRAIRNFKNIFKTINKADISKQGPAKLIRASQFSASFSFFNYVFINPSVSENEAEEIMNHEIVHVRQRHWFDLLLVEMLRLIQWINPFAWIYTRFIRLNHEYLADQVALQRSDSPANYRAALMNQLFESPVISLSNSFNYSLNKKRFDMMKKIITSPYRKLKVLLVLPVFAIVIYAFATPEYHYQPKAVNPTSETTLSTIETSSPIQPSKEEKKIAIEKGATQDTSKFTFKIGKDFINNPKTLVIIDGINSNNKTLQSIDPNAIESISILKDKSATALYGAKGDNGVIIVTTKRKPALTVQTPVKKEQEVVNALVTQQEKPKKAVFVDGVFTDKSFSQISKELGHNWGTMKPFSPEEGLEKFGEQGKNGGYDIITRKKALEMGLNPPYPRISPEDYPTFKGEGHGSFNDWLIGQLKYPEDARSGGVSGTVRASFVVNPDGTLTNPAVMYSPDKSLGDAVINVMTSSPRWDPPKNPESIDPFKASVSIKFELPDQIYIPEEPFVVVEEMPMFPGGDGALLKYIAENTHYPEYAKTNMITGRVIIRFVVGKEGKALEPTVLKGVDPSLDAEAIRVVSSLPVFSPGKQGGKPVPVYYMVPITFSLTDQKPIFSESSEVEILKFQGQNTGYPQEAKNSSDTGKVYVIVKMNKGGTIKECVAVNDIKGNTIPVMKEVIIVGYNPSTGLQGPPVKANTTSKDRKVLQTECIRVAKNLSKLNLPEWKDKDMEFVLSFKFILK
jgi:TonB family protein